MGIQRNIEKLGYTRKEAKVYLASLNHGNATITELAQWVSMPRTSCELIVRDLRKKGLMNYFNKKRRRFNWH